MSAVLSGYLLEDQMNAEIQLTFLFIESLQEIRNLLGGKMWRPEVSLGSFLEIPPIVNIAGFATGF